MLVLAVWLAADYADYRLRKYVRVEEWR